MKAFVGVRRADLEEASRPIPTPMKSSYPCPPFILHSRSTLVALLIQTLYTWYIVKVIVSS